MKKKNIGCVHEPNVKKKLFLNLLCSVEICAKFAAMPRDALCQRADFEVWKMFLQYFDIFALNCGPVFIKNPTNF